MVTWSCLGVSIHARPSLDIRGMKFDRKLTFEDHVRGIASHISQRIGILRLVKHVIMDTYVLLRCYYAFVHPILMYYSPVWGSAVNYYNSFLTGDSDQFDHLISQKTKVPFRRVIGNEVFS